MRNKTSVKLTEHYCRNASQTKITQDVASQVRLNVRAGKTKTSKWWDMRLSYNGKQVNPTLGHYPAMSLAEARFEAGRRKELARQGRDPRLAKPDTPGALTFEDCLSGFLADNPGPAADPQWEQHARDYILPMLGYRPVEEISLEDVLEVLRPIWTTKNETARRTQSKIKRILAWAIAHQHRGPYNPGFWSGNLSAVLPAKKEVRHQSAVPIEDAPRFWADLATRRGVGVDALAFLVLTGQRTANVLHAKTEEFRFHRDGTGRWDIPGVAMKTRKPHTLPLQRQAVELVKRQPSFGSGGLVFVMASKSLSYNTMRQQMLKMSAADQRRGGAGYMDGEHVDRHAVPHGWRSTFRSWGANKGIEREALEKQLAHDIGSAVERAYQRADMIDRRLAIMEQWTAFLEDQDDG